MSYLELSEEEIDELVSFIYERTEELKGIESSLDRLTENFRTLTVEELEIQPHEIRAGIMAAKASLLSNVTTVSYSVSGLIQKLISVPSRVLNALLTFLSSFWRIILKYIGIFKIESITVTIGVTPSVTVVFKP
jgi:hypothetical protein